VKEAALYEAASGGRQSGLTEDDDHVLLLLYREKHGLGMCCIRRTCFTKGRRQDYRFMPEPDLPPLVLNAAVGRMCIGQRRGTLAGLAAGWSD
jgi:hypothetical protein